MIQLYLHSRILCRIRWIDMILTVLGPLRADKLSLAHRWPQIGPQKNHAQLPKHYTQNTYTTQQNHFF